MFITFKYVPESTYITYGVSHFQRCITKSIYYPIILGFYSFSSSYTIFRRGYVLKSRSFGSKTKMLRQEITVLHKFITYSKNIWLIQKNVDLATNSIKIQQYIFILLIVINCCHIQFHYLSNRKKQRYRGTESRSTTSMGHKTKKGLPFYMGIKPPVRLSQHYVQILFSLAQTTQFLKKYF